MCLDEILAQFPTTNKDDKSPKCDSSSAGLVNQNIYHDNYHNYLPIYQSLTSYNIHILKNILICRKVYLQV